MKKIENIKKWNEFWWSLFQFKNKLYQEYQDVIEIILFIVYTSFYMYCFQKKWWIVIKKDNFIYDFIIDPKIVNNYSFLKSEEDKVEFSRFIYKHHSNIQELKSKNYELYLLFSYLIHKNEDVSDYLNAYKKWWEYFSFNNWKTLYFWEHRYQTLFFLFRFSELLIDKKRFDSSKYNLNLESLCKFEYKKSNKKYKYDISLKIWNYYSLAIQIINFLKRKNLTLNKNLWIYYLLLKEFLYIKKNIFEKVVIDWLYTSVFQEHCRNYSQWINLIFDLFKNWENFKKEIKEYIYWDKEFSKEIQDKFHSIWYNWYIMRTYKLLRYEYKFIEEKIEIIKNKLDWWYLSFLDHFSDWQLEKYYWSWEEYFE